MFEYTHGIFEEKYVLKIIFYKIKKIKR